MIHNGAESYVTAHRSSLNALLRTGNTWKAGSWDVVKATIGTSDSEVFTVQPAPGTESQSAVSGGFLSELLDGPNCLNEDT